jgi:hypothetical protein
MTQLMNLDAVLPDRGPSAPSLNRPSAIFFRVLCGHSVALCGAFVTELPAGGHRRACFRNRFLCSGLFWLTSTTIIGWVPYPCIAQFISLCSRWW